MARAVLPEGAAVRFWFEHYATTFGTVEINNSFYMLPKPETFGKWRDQAPDGFRYAVKANRFLTQAKKLKDCAEPLERMMGAFQHLGPALGRPSISCRRASGSTSNGWRISCPGAEGRG